MNDAEMGVDDSLIAGAIAIVASFAIVGCAAIFLFAAKCVFEKMASAFNEMTRKPVSFSKDIPMKPYPRIKSIKRDYRKYRAG